jgi:hypothetical protein
MNDTENFGRMPVRKPNFFIVGAPKCGTTGMFQFLRVHPDIFMPEFKEPHFFGNDMKLPSNRRTLTWYESLFQASGDESMIGEASPSYLYSKTAALEIKKYCENAKIIIMVRDPVEMLYSDYYQRLAARFEIVNDFEEAIFATNGEAARFRARVEKKLGMRQPDYLELPKLGKQAKRYLDVFDRENVHFVIYDDFKADNQKEYRRVLNFLGVDENFQPEFQVVNPNKKIRSLLLKNFISGTPAIIKKYARKYPLIVRAKDSIHNMNIVQFQRPKMDPGLNRRLKAVFAQDVELLSELTGRNLNHWTEP